MAKHRDDFEELPGLSEELSEAELAGGVGSLKTQDGTGEVTSARRGPMDLPFLVLTLLILAIGVLMVLTASFARSFYEENNATYYFVRQFWFAVGGVAIMLVVSRMKVKTFRKWSKLLYLISVGMLLLVPVIGVTRGGATRWLSLGFTNFQPSEVAKAAIVLLYAGMICSYKEKMTTFKYGVLPFLLLTAVVLGLLVLEPHLSACVIIVALTVVMMFAGGTKLRWFAVALGGTAAAGYLAVSNIAYAAARVNIWKDPFSDLRGDGWQTVQSLYSVGSGGLLGLGLGQGRQKYLYLPEEHNDFIFSVVCEELGFIGAMLILALFALLIIRGFWLAMNARDRYGSLIVTGLTALLSIQVFLNVAVVTNLIPCTGISLPFFSYGGTALWIQMAEVGVILSVSRDIPPKAKPHNSSPDG